MLHADTSFYCTHSFKDRINKETDWFEIRRKWRKPDTENFISLSSSKVYTDNQISGLRFGSYKTFTWNLYCKTKILRRTIANIPWYQSVLNFFQVCDFDVLRAVAKYRNCSTLSKYVLSAFMLWFCLAFNFRDMNPYLVFSAFIPPPTSFVAANKAWSTMWIFMYNVE
jgi:hypothetical protein